MSSLASSMECGENKLGLKRPVSLNGLRRGLDESPLPREDAKDNGESMTLSTVGKQESVFYFVGDHILV